MLSPYIGSRVLEHFGTEEGAHAIQRYGVDKSGTRAYRFNSLGFRCEEFRPEALRKIYVCGCSYSLGTGLDVEETWPEQFKRYYAAHAAVGQEDICLMNFSQGGSSNRYVSRTLLEQATKCSPDLVIAQFSHVERTEFLLEGDSVTSMSSDPRARYIAVAPLGPWLSMPWWQRWTQARSVPYFWRKPARRIQAWARKYYQGIYNESRAVYETLQDILSLQLYCASKGITCLVSCVDHERLSDEKLTRNRAIAALRGLVDREGFLDFSITDRHIAVDVAADGMHPGARSHEIFASLLWNAYVGIQSGSNS